MYKPDPVTSPLPHLSGVPARYPQCCASLSLPLIAFLDKALPPPPALTLSVGSGSGLLEALLVANSPRRALSPVSLLGIEVAGPNEIADSPNLFLPEQHIVSVPGTWALSGHVEDARGLLFVYPRQVGLVKRYLDRGLHVRAAIVIAPKSDRDDFLPVLQGWGRELPCNQSEPSLDPAETVLAFERKVSFSFGQEDTVPTEQHRGQS